MEVSITILSLFAAYFAIFLVAAICAFDLIRILKYNIVIITDFIVDYTEPKSTVEHIEKSIVDDFSKKLVEYPIGTIVNYRGVIVEVTKTVIGCVGCVFATTKCPFLANDIDCTADGRKDKTEVILKLK